MRFDWRWIVLIVIIAIIVGGQRLPWPILTLALVGGGGYLLYLGWQIWNGASPTDDKRVTYWRGQRIELAPEKNRKLPSLRSIGPALFYLIFGSILVLSAIAIVLRNVGA